MIHIVLLSGYYVLHLRRVCRLYLCIRLARLDREEVGEKKRAMVVYVVQCLELSFRQLAVELGTGGDY